MCDLTFINRARDGLPLVEAWNENKTIENLNNIKAQAKSITRQSLSLAPGGHYQGPNCMYYFIVENGICFMTACAKNFPKKVAFAYLFEIQRCFLEELRKEYANSFTSYEAIIDSIENSYTFIRFDTVIHRKINDFQNPPSMGHLEKVNEDLKSVSNILYDNINHLLDRGVKLDEIEQRAYGLKRSTAELKGTSKKLMLQALYQKYLPYLLVTIIIFLVIAWKLFL